MAISGQAKQQKGPGWPTDLLADGPPISSANSETLAAFRAWNRAKPAAKDGLTEPVHTSAAEETWYCSFRLWVNAFTTRQWAALEGGYNPESWTRAQEHYVLWKVHTGGLHLWGAW